jgi:hypothetical protein
VSVAGVALAPLAAALVAEQASYERFKETRLAVASPGNGWEESAGFYVLTESNYGDQRVQQLGNTARKKRSGTDPDVFNKVQPSGLLGVPKPKVITLFPSSNVPRAAIPNSGGGYTSTGGSYRTVCVRLCDGYYWPISYGGSRGDAYGDKEACESSCSAEVRVFTVPVDGAMEDARDLKGKSYSRLPNAFRYRNEYVPSCKCKADPWEQASLDRHKKYAELAKSGKLAKLEKASNRKKRRKRQIETTATLVGYDTTYGAIAPADSEASGETPTVVKTKRSKKAASGGLKIVTQSTRKASKKASTARKVSQIDQTVRSTKRLTSLGGKSRALSSTFNRRSDRR